MEEAKVALISCNFSDYPREDVEELVRIANETVTDASAKVVCSSKIFDMDEARRAAKEWATEDFDCIIVLITAWFEPPHLIEVIRPYLHKPILLWGLSAYEKDGVLISSGSIASYSAMGQPLKAMGAKFKMTYGSAKSPKIKNDIKSFLAVARTVANLAESTIGMMGYADMGLYNAAFDGVSLRKQIGPEVVNFGMNELVDYMNKIDESAIAQEIDKMRKRWEFTQGEPSEEGMRTCAKMYLALKRMSEEKRFNALTIKCVHGLREHFGFTACTPMSMLGDQVDYVCECDVMGATTQLMLHYLTENSTTFVEMYDIIPDRILVGVCGFTPFGMTDGNIKITETSWGGGFAGFFNTSKMKEGRVTLARLTSIGNRYSMHIVAGDAKLPRKWIELGWPFPDNAYPSLEVVLDGSVDHFAENISAQHFALSYGDHQKELLDLCNYLDIETVTED